MQILRGAERYGTLFLVAVLLGACGAGPGSSAAHGSVSVAGGQARAGATVPVPLSRASAGGGTGSGSLTGAAGPGSQAGGVQAAPGDVRAAEAALTGFLRAYTADDVNGVATSSDQGALAMAGVVLDAEAINGARGATTTVTAAPAQFSEAGGSTTNAVILQGAVALTTTISGAQGTGRYDDTISGPVTVRAEGGTWKVTDFSYDGQPIEYWPTHVGQTVNGLHVALGYVVSYGSVTAALVSLAQTAGSASVQLQSCSLQTASGDQSGTGDFTGPPEPAGVLRFSRIAAPPSGLILQFGSSNGQTESFDLAVP